MIALLFLRPDGIASQSNLVAANHLASREQSQSTLTLHYDDLVGLPWGTDWNGARACQYPDQ